MITANSHALAFYDGYPVTKYHSLVIPKRHVKTYFDLTNKEHNCIQALLIFMKDEIMKRDCSVAGFNLGWNCGSVAGQTVFHAHAHLIPRRAGDVDNPRGGVRHIIPGKGTY